MKRRPPTTLSLSFLDAICCGFGAVLLLFLILSHNAVAERRVATDALQREVDALTQQVVSARAQAAALGASVEQAGARRARVLAQARTITESIAGHRYDLAQLDANSVAREAHLNRLKADLKSSDEALRRLEGGARQRAEEGDRLRAFPGEGDRQYLTGLKVGGERILILFDTSASMLAERIVDVVRLRNLPEGERRKAAKWQRALATVDWIATQIPPGARFQLFTFNEQAGPVLQDTASRWLDAGDAAVLNRAVEATQRLVPQGGTSLHHALDVINRLQPRPDNVFLVTDGLPTIDRERGEAYTVSGEQRLRFFDAALAALPRGVPVNVILLPMEGDPLAAAAYWRLAQWTRGSFLSPAEDWP
jgi:von Willebrand factor type A domain